MNILFICHRLPFPPNRGGKIRPFHFIKHLNQTHQVTVATLAESTEELEAGQELRNYCQKLIVKKVSPPIRWGKVLLRLPASSPSSSGYFASLKLFMHLRQQAKEVRYDLVLVHCAFVARYSRLFSNTPLWMDFGDLDSGKWLEYQKFRSFPLSWAFGYEAKKLRAYEAAIAKKAAVCTFTTPNELDEFQSLNVGVPTQVIPNGVNLEYFHDRDEVKVEQDSIVFVGRLDYYPNKQGIQWFVHHVFPLIRQAVPRASLMIVGSNPDASVKRLSDVPGVVVTGHVPDVRPYLRKAVVAVAPLKIARGVQNKILEAMAIGTPVVATVEASRGIQASDRQCLLIGKDAEDFAAQVVQVLRNAQMRKMLSENGRYLIRQHYTWKGSMELVDQILEKI
jgi:polysaccharide biosynthesis protein PslH